MKTTYVIKDLKSFIIHYMDGELLKITVLTQDKIEFDNMKHSIEFYETDLNKELFKRVE